MDYNLYLEQLYEIIGYLWGQINVPDISAYYQHILVTAFLIIVFCVLLRIVKKKMAVSEYIEDGVALVIEFPVMCNAGNRVKRILTDLYKELYNLYGKKYYFAIEMLVRRGKNIFFIYLPRKIFENIKESWAKEYNLKVVTESRDEFLTNLQTTIVGLDFELARDFVYPLVLPEKVGTILNDTIREREWLMVQLVCRPCGNKWQENLKSYLHDLENGKEPLRCLSGCFGSFLYMILPAFVFLGDFITFLVHGGEVDKGGKSGRSGDSKDSHIRSCLQKEADIIDSKQSKYGFETFLRVCANSEDKDRAYLILDRLLDLVTCESEKGNYYVVRNLYKKFKGSVKNDLMLAYIDKSSVDVLNRDEISNVVRSLIST